VFDLTPFGAAGRAASMGWLLDCDWRAADIRGRGAAEGDRRRVPSKLDESEP
jgi:hypothetical protein